MQHRTACPICRRAVVAERIGDGAIVSGPGPRRRVLAGRCPHPSCSAVVCAEARDAAEPARLVPVDAAFGTSTKETARWLASFLLPSVIVLVLMLFPASLFAEGYATHAIGAGRIVVMMAACALAMPLGGILWFVWVGALDELSDLRLARERARRGEDRSLALVPDPVSYRAY